MIHLAADQIASLFAGKQSIKTMMAGAVPVYERPGGYIYLVLDAAPKDRPSQIQNEKE